jgi:hypothetical protein
LLAARQISSVNTVRVVYLQARFSCSFSCSDLDLPGQGLAGWDTLPRMVDKLLRMPLAAGMLDTVLAGPLHLGADAFLDLDTGDNQGLVGCRLACRDAPGDRVPTFGSRALPSQSPLSICACTC